MASFISALSIFVLVLSNGCFTLPIDNEQLSSSTSSSSSSSFHNNFNNEQTSTLQWVSDSQTHGYPYLNKHDSSEEHMGFESTSTTGQPDNDKRFYDYILSSSSEPTTEVTGLKRENYSSNSQSGTEVDYGKREMQVQFLSNNTWPTTSTTTSTFVPLLFGSESSSSTSTSTSTEKYTGLLKYEKVHEEEQEQQPTKPIKKLNKPTPQSQTQFESESEEDTHGSTAPTALFDQEASDRNLNVNNYAMILDDNNTLVVTDFPKKWSTTTWENSKEVKPLNQGSTLLLFLLAALLFFACVMASTLACVKNRYTLKRRSRITEMEAHLDEHYPPTFMFQHHQTK